MWFQACLCLIVIIFSSSSACRSSITLETNISAAITLQELRDIAATEAVKGKHFFLETDIKGPALKLDNTGKAILTVSGSLFSW